MADLLLGSSVAKLSASPSAEVRGFKRRLPRAVRKALEKTFEYWMKKYAPLHFKRTAFNKYPEYKNNYKYAYRKGRKYSYKKSEGQRELARLDWRVRKGYDTENPLVRGGALKRAFLKGTYKFTGNNYTLRVSWPSLPNYAYKYRPNQMKKYDALTQTTQLEQKTLAEVFDKFLQAEINKIDPATKKSFGRIVV